MPKWWNGIRVSFRNWILWVRIPPWVQNIRWCNGNTLGQRTLLTGSNPDRYGNYVGSNPTLIFYMPIWWKGRHATLRTWCLNKRVGSNPTMGTKIYYALVVQRLEYVAYIHQTKVRFLPRVQKLYSSQI